jgi:hypothetical protein
MSEEYGELQDGYHKSTPYIPFNLHFIEEVGEKGEYKYIISSEWWEKWLSYADFDVKK